MFQGCVEQTFDDEKHFVSKNSAFADEFALNIKNQYMVIDTKLGNLNFLL